MTCSSFGSFFYSFTHSSFVATSSFVKIRQFLLELFVFYMNNKKLNNWKRNFQTFLILKSLIASQRVELNIKEAYFRYYL